MIEQVKKQEEMNSLRHAEEQLEKSSYKCEKCRDMLFILQGDGSAKECECRQIRIAEEKLKASGISEEFRNKRFENYKYDKSTKMMEAFLTAKNYSKKFEYIRAARRNSCLLSGQVGSGKTHLGMSIANNLLDKSIGVIYMPYRSIITNLKQSITDEYNYQREIQRYKNAQVLLIDDLFKGRITESDTNIIYEIVDYRYFKNLPMIVTTEKTVENLLDVDEAIGSRLYEMSKDYVVTMQGKELNYRVYGG
ncbi:ATP-binding protein [Clostridium sp. CCUG 7971]|uniref:ATP-binding protein n=1 Tax=Clostridium sp. CCUG 7971 TaxID=2811414 RepID=UPI0025702BE1|nr:ATP-binding protein [Clostridium sp. CCUG 7971]